MKKNKKPWGYNMIRVNVRFNVSDLPEGGSIDDRTAWATGSITLPHNKYRGIEGDKVLFNGLDELMPKMRGLLKKNEIKLLKLPAKKADFEDL